MKDADLRLLRVVLFSAACWLLTTADLLLCLSYTIVFLDLSSIGKKLDCEEPCCKSFVPKDYMAHLVCDTVNS